MTGENKAQWPIDGLLYPDSDSYGGLHHSKAIIAKLQRRGPGKKVEAVVLGACKAKSKAETARAGGDLPKIHIACQAAIPSHLSDAELSNRFQCAKQNTSGPTRKFAGHVHAEIAPIDSINVGMAGGAKQHLIARCGSAKGVSGGIGRNIVRTKVGF